MIKAFGISALMFATFGLASSARAEQQQQQQQVEKPCMADAARLCSGIEPGGGAQIQCLKAHKDELSPDCKKKVLQKKVEMKEQQELQKEQAPSPQPPSQ
jgi:hypothetical protein